MIGKLISRRTRIRAAWCCTVVAAAVAIGIAPAGAAAVPGAPTVTSAVAAKQGATLTFSRPASDGGARILDYRVTCTSSDGGATVKRTTAKSPIAITGMAVKRHYTCVVAARNSAGVGPASKPSTTVVPLPQDEQQVPVAPAQVFVRADVESIFVDYSRPPYDPHRTRLTINRYRAKCSSSNGGVTHREERSWTKPGIPVQHVTAGRTYRCIASARNSNGWGPYSAPSDPVVPRFQPGAPGAPKITSASAIVRGITVAFVPPTRDGGSPVLDYRIRCTSSNGGVTAERSLLRHSPYSVVGLSVGKTYTCALAARNKAGVGAFSAPSHPAVPLAG
jgi:large repetitive protein